MICKYICVGIIALYYTVCCGAMGYSLCKEHYDAKMKRKREYEILPTTAPNIQMMGEREYEYHQNHNKKLSAIPEEYEDEKVFEY